MRCCNFKVFLVIHGNLMNQCGGSVDDVSSRCLHNVVDDGIGRCLHNTNNLHLLQPQQQAVCICQIPKTNLDFVLYKISQTIDDTKERATTSDRNEQSALEWKKVSLVVDRFLLLVVNCIFGSSLVLIQHIQG